MLPEEDKSAPPTGFMMGYAQAIEAFELFKRGVLFEAGGWLDQAPQYRHDILVCMRLESDSMERVQKIVSKTPPTQH